jgi:epoxyqueuosine reductase
MVDSAEVKATARRLGFQLVGITTPDPPPHLAVYQAWLEAGRHGEMAYLASERARQRRADPRLIMPLDPGARTALRQAP